MGPFEILCGIGIAILALYYYCTSTYDFWKSRGVAGPQPVPPFGNIKDVMFAKLSMSDYLTELYNEYKDERMFGMFTRKTPILILRDLELIKDVLIKDFSKFADRGFSSVDKAEPLSQHIFFLEPERWRPLRMKLSPVFTSGKLREMFPLMLECAEQLEHYLDKLVSKNEPVECRELMAKYATDVIGSCAFGIDTQSLSDEDSEFRKMGRKVFAPTWRNVTRARLRQMIPRLYNALGYILPYSDITKFFTRTIKENIEYREKNNVVRHDFVDLLRELKNHPEKISIEMTDTLLAAQAFVFFLAGFETSSTTMSHALYELAQNSKIQDRLREEIDAHVKDGTKFSYDDIKKMSYLDKVFKETLRKYPPGTFLIRRSITNYTFDGTNVSIPNKQMVWIPIFAIHRDPDIYPEPDVFDPERFDEANVQSRNTMSYLPFGDGPRNCIGARFAVYQTKIGLVKILQNYKVETCEKTQIPYIIDPKAFVLSPKHGIDLRITKINRN